MAGTKIHIEIAEDLKMNTALNRKVVEMHASLPVGRIPPPRPIQKPHANLTHVISTRGNPALAHLTRAILTHLTLVDQTLINLEAMGGQRSGKGMIVK